MIIYYMQSFKEFVGAFGNTAEKGLQGQTFGIGKSLMLPTPTLDIPTQSITGRIQSIFYTQNPITVVLDNGTTWKLTFEQWKYLKKLGKELQEGRQVMIELFLDGTIKSVNLI